MLILCTIQGVTACHMLMLVSEMGKLSIVTDVFNLWTFTDRNQA